MTHAQLVERAVAWLRGYRCGVVLSEQACISGEMPDAIGWKRARIPCCRVQGFPGRLSADRTSHSVTNPSWDWAAKLLSNALAAAGPKEVRRAGTARSRGRKIEVVRRSAPTCAARRLAYEMNLLLASLRRVEIRIEPNPLPTFSSGKTACSNTTGAVPAVWNQPSGAKLFSGERKPGDSARQRDEVDNPEA